MTPETPDLAGLVARLERLVDRVDALEVQVRGLMTSQTVEARRFVVQDIRGVIRAQLEMTRFAPSLTFYDPEGKERLRVGLRLDSSPLLRVEQREVPLG